MATLQEIVAEVDRRADGRPIGKMQTFRTATKGLKRQNRRVFGGLKHDDWTFHRGGREELQFNIGFEEGNEKGRLRYGVAFSLEPSRTLPSINLLLPKVARFNDYLRQNPEDLADLWMWEYAPDLRTPHRPGPIERQFARPKVFVFLGGAGDPEAPDYHAILNTLDRLMPLYRHVEAGTAESITSSEEMFPPRQPGCPERALHASASLAERLLDIDLRHNALQTQLHRELVIEYGYDYVFVEQPAPGSGGRVDVLVEKDSLRIIYEIKTAVSARGCIREAMGQLLDYGCWPGSQTTERLVVVGEPKLEPLEARYLAELNQSFPRPVEYRSVALAEA